MRYVYIMVSIMALLHGYEKNSEYGKNLTEKIESIKRNTVYVEPIVLKSMLEKPANKGGLYILDVRETNEVDPEGYIKTDRYVNIPRGLVEFKIQQNISDLEAPIVVVCYTETRSLFVAQRLKDLGYKRVSVLKGGMEKWNEECLPKSHSSNLFFKENKKGSCGGEGESGGFGFIRTGVSFEK